MKALTGGIYLMATLAVPSLPAAEALRLAATVPLPRVSGRFDHFAVDPVNRRLFVAALGNDTVEIIDVEKAARVHSIAGQRMPAGVAFADGRLVVANGRDGTLRTFDGQSFAFQARLSSIDDADNVRLDAGARRLYVGYGDGALGVTDVNAGKVLNRIPLKAHPESFQLERNGPRIFVNVPDAEMIAVVDRAKGVVVAEWPMRDFRANFPMALDEPRHRLFVGCRRPARLVIFDTTQGKPIADLEISGDTDDLFFDAKRQRLYVSCGEGFVDVIQCQDATGYQRVARMPTRSGARTSFFSPELDRLFVAVPQRGGQDAEIRLYQPQ